MKQIPLTQGQFALVDDDDFEYLNKLKWYACYAPNIKSFYAVHTARINKRNVGIRMHRLIMNVTERHIFIDHEDHNTLNNQRSNLRIATASQNCANSKKKGNNATSKFIGVYYWKIIINGKAYVYWKARICKDRKRISLGQFPTEKAAARAYDEAAKALHGEFANLNFKTA